MDIIFHHRLSVGEVSGIMICAIAAFISLWVRQPVSVIIGVLFLVLAVLFIERAIHTTYIITSDGWLRVDRGRLSGKANVRIADISRCTKVRLMGGLTHYLLIEYGGKGRLLHVQPADEDRMKRIIDKVKAE